MKRIYLDYAASTPLDPRVLEAMKPYWRGDFANAHASHEEGRKARGAVEKARNEIASYIGAKSQEIIFTSGGTESNNMAIFGLVDHLRGKNKKKPLHVITSSIEHPSVLDCFKKLEKDGVHASYIGVDKEGIILLDELEKSLTEDTVLVSIMYANNEIGTIQPVAEIGKILKKYRREHKTKTPFFHTDASQAPLFVKLDVENLGVDFLTVDAQKLYGPKGVGALYIRNRVEINPILYGGKQEGGLRPGTLNTPGIVGFSEAYKIAEGQRAGDIKSVGALRDYFMSAIRRVLPDAYINGSLTERLPNNVNISFPGIEGEYLVLALDEKGIAVSSKSACLSGGGEGSYVVSAIDRSRAKNAVRFTLGRETNREELDYVLEALLEAVERFQKM